MGIMAALETGDGKRLATVEDPTNVLHRILPDAGSAEHPTLGSIDWYGDTVFNYLQAPQFLAEWRSLKVEVSQPETRRLFEAILNLAERLREDRHVYLKFYGD